MYFGRFTTLPKSWAYRQYTNTTKFKKLSRFQIISCKLFQIHILVFVFYKTVCFHLNINVNMLNVSLDVNKIGTMSAVYR